MDATAISADAKNCEVVNGSRKPKVTHHSFLESLHIVMSKFNSLIAMVTNKVMMPIGP